jgi:23S rRNA (guanine745-N1)-methyltransferase
MVAARERFLAAGHYRPLVDALVAEASRPAEDEENVEASQVKGGPSGSGDLAVLDLGCGTGYYLAAVLDALPGRIGIGVDNSKFAARRAAKAHERASAVVADIWDEIPVRDGSAELMLNLFSPRNGEEMARILAPGGRLVVVTPQAGHLAELIDRFGMISVDPDKEERLERSLRPLSGQPESVDLNWTMSLGPGGVRDLVQMGPSADRMNKADMDQQIEKLDELTEVTAAVSLTTVVKENLQ